MWGKQFIIKEYNTLLIMNKSKKYMKYCNVYGCMNKARSVAESGLSFFRVPSDIKRRREWLKVIDREDLKEEKNLNKVYSYVCSIHFDDSDIINTTIKRLKSDAVPTMFLPQKFHGNTKSEDDSDSDSLQQSSEDILPHLPPKDTTILLSTYSHSETQTERKPKTEITKSNSKINALINTIKQQSIVTSTKSPLIHITDPTTNVLSYQSKEQTLMNSTSTQTDVLLTSNKQTQTSTTLSNKVSHKRNLKKETETDQCKRNRLKEDIFEIKKKRRSIGFRRHSC